MGTGPDKIAIWVLTPRGRDLAENLRKLSDGVVVYCSLHLYPACRGLAAQPFDGLMAAVKECFRCFDGHIFIMATGIVVRAIGPLLGHKTTDPAVVVVDDQGKFAISLLCGHIGGANRMAARTAELLGATAVITTATDVNGRPAIDTLAVERGLTIENPAAIKGVNMALLTGGVLRVFDPHGLLKDGLDGQAEPVERAALASSDGTRPGVYVDDAVVPLAGDVLILRPPSLVAGIGCNRNTPSEELRGFLEEVLADQGLSLWSLQAIATIDVKSDEPGLVALAAGLGVPLHFYSRDALNRIVHVPNPSRMVEQHVGVPSVCEAAAILASRQGRLIVAKQKSAHVTVAIARRDSLSSASAPEA
jgi:cobalt-precorrin 5A hydrolase